MIRGTTPDYILTVNADLTGTTVYVTFKQLRMSVDIKDPPVTVSEGTSTIAIRLTQEQTLSLSEGRADIQVKYIASDGTVRATDIQPVTVSRALLERVVTYG